MSQKKPNLLASHIVFFTRFLAMAVFTPFVVQVTISLVFVVFFFWEHAVCKTNANKYERRN